MKTSTTTISPLVFFDFAHDYGGSFKSTVLLVRQLQTLIPVIVIDVYGTNEDYISDLRASGIPVVTLFPDWKGRVTIGGRRGLPRLLMLVKFALHMSGVVFRLRRAVLETGPSAVWVNSEKALLIAWLGMPKSVPLVVYVRTELTEVRYYCRFAWHRANMALGVSRRSLDFLRLTNYARGNFHIVHNGINLDETIEQAKPEPANIPTVKPGALHYVLPASLGSPLKGHETAIRALHQYTEGGGQASLWLCGGIPTGAPSAFLRRLKELVEDLDLKDHVHFLGWRKDVLSIMARTDVVILPSFSEGMPRSLLEAMALGKPIISTKVGGISELVRDQIDGILVNPGDVDTVVQAMKALEDAVTRHQLGQAGQQRVRDVFSLEGQAAQFLRAINGLAQKDR